jgi:hypothetical protein
MYQPGGKRARVVCIRARGTRAQRKTHPSAVRLSVDCQRVSSSANPASEVLIIPRARPARARGPSSSSSPSPEPSEPKCDRPAPHPVTAARVDCTPLHSFLPASLSRPSSALAARPLSRPPPSLSSHSFRPRGAHVLRTSSAHCQDRRRHRHARRHRPARRRAVQRARARAHARARGAVRPGQVVPGPELLQRLDILQQDRRPHPRQRHVRPRSAPAGVYTVGG